MLVREALSPRASLGAPEKGGLQSTFRLRLCTSMNDWHYGERIPTCPSWPGGEMAVNVNLEQVRAGGESGPGGGRYEPVRSRKHPTLMPRANRAASPESPHSLIHHHRPPPTKHASADMNTCFSLYFKSAMTSLILST